MLLKHDGARGPRTLTHLNREIDQRDDDCEPADQLSDVSETFERHLAPPKRLANLPVIGIASEEYDAHENLNSPEQEE